MTVFKYEVEIQVTDRRTGKSVAVTRTEHAYSVMDAMMQAVVNQRTDQDHEEVRVIRIGPPAGAIADSEAGLARQITEMLQRGRPGILAAIAKRT
jgi:intracellular sulfur oxidation DsrE/DsrF family protein